MDSGLVRSIGVSNFNSEQIQRICDNCRIKPAVNQVQCGERERDEETELDGS